MKGSSICKEFNIIIFIFASFIKGTHDFEKFMLRLDNKGNYILKDHCHKDCHQNQLGLLAIMADRSLMHYLKCKRAKI